MEITINTTIQVSSLLNLFDCLHVWEIFPIRIIEKVWTLYKSQELPYAQNKHKQDRKVYGYKHMQVDTGSPKLKTHFLKEILTYYSFEAISRILGRVQLFLEPLIFSTGIYNLKKKEKMVKNYFDRRKIKQRHFPIW